jgi:hypothetical protein
VLIDVEDVALGHDTRMSWNPEPEWIFSPQPVHEVVIDQDTFTKAQALLATPTPAKTPRGQTHDESHLPPARPALLRELRPSHGRLLEQPPGSLPLQAHRRGRPAPGRRTHV